MPRETSVEKRLVMQVRGAGGQCYKWLPTPVAGVPDRLVCLRGRVFLVETKTKGGDLEPIQVVRHAEIRATGVEVYVLWNREQVDNWVEERLREGTP
jgi:hypothetical protein